MKLPSIKTLFDMLRARIVRVSYSQITGLMYMITAVIAAITTPRGSVGFMVNQDGLPLDVLMAVFVIGSVILLSKPSLIWFTVAQLPVAMYVFGAIVYIYTQNIRGEAITVYYAIMVLVAPMTTRLKASSRIRIHHVYGCLLALIGVAVLAYPARGTIAYIENAYGLTAVMIGTSLVVAAVYVMIANSSDALKHVCILVLFYMGCTAVVAWTSHTYIAAMVSLSSAIAVFTTILKADSFFMDTRIAQADAFLTQSLTPSKEGA